MGAYGVSTSVTWVSDIWLPEVFVVHVPVVVLVGLEFVFFGSLNFFWVQRLCFSFSGWYYRIWVSYFRDELLIYRRYFNLFKLYVMKLSLDSMLRFVLLLLSPTFSIVSSFFLWLSSFFCLFLSLSAFLLLAFFSLILFFTSSFSLSLSFSVFPWLFHSFSF